MSYVSLPGETSKAAGRVRPRPVVAQKKVPDGESVDPTILGSYLLSPAPAGALRTSLSAVQAAAGNRAATLQVAAWQQTSVQRNGGGKPVDPRFTNDPIGTAIEQAKQKFPQYADKLSQIRFRAVTKGDRTTVTITGQGSFVYPSA
ncbi:MAG TPA: hypothetical protein VFP34_14305, partial [Microlunatus sp.]|nr:hypothetical protein [Microlunatus sp.]